MMKLKSKSFSWLWPLVLLVFSGGQLKAQLPSPELGSTQLFWVYGRGFFSGYYRISATLQAQNDQVYVFVENSAINDIAIADSMILLGTQSGVMYSSDLGATWQPMNGTSGLLPDDYRTGGGDSAPQHRVPVTTVFFNDSDDWVVGCGVGPTSPPEFSSSGSIINVYKGIYRTKNGGGKWSPVTRGMPSDGSARPEIYEIIRDPNADDQLFVATQAGLLLFKKRKFVDWVAQGLPQITGEWPHLNTYDVVFDSSQSKLTVATALGLFTGKVDYDNSMVSWKPMGTTAVAVETVTIYYDSTLVEYEETVNDTFVFTFSDSAVSMPGSDGLYTIWVDGDSVGTGYISVSVSHDTVFAVTSTVETRDSIQVTNVGPRVYLDSGSAASLTPNQWVVVEDTSLELYWSGKARFENDNWYVGLGSDNQYYWNTTKIDADTIDYSVWTPDPNNLIVIPTGTESYSTLVPDGAGGYYLGAADGLYHYDGNSIILADSVFSGVSVNDLLAATNGGIFAGTAVGLYRLSGGTWEKVSPVITDGYSGTEHQFDLDVRTIAEDSNGNLYFGGPLGGLYVSSDGGDTWATLNNGLSNRMVTNDDVQQFMSAFTSGAFDTLTQWLGDFPDVDQDSKLYILLTDLSDEYYSSQGDGVTYISGDFQTIDQFNPQDTTVANSNYRDMIYVDTNPQNITSATAIEAAFFQLGRMILYHNDADEEEWLVNGLAGFGTFIADRKEAKDYSIVSNNGLTIWADVLPVRKDYDHVFVFTEYIYEYYLTTPDAFRAWAADTSNGLASLENNISADLGDVFHNFALAVFLDGKTDANGNVLGDGYYDFANLNVSFTSSRLDWGTTGGDSPYSFTTKPYSIGYYVTDGAYNGVYWAKYLGDKLVFNGDDESQLEFTVVLTGDADADGSLSASMVTPVTLNDRNWGEFTAMSDFDKGLDDIRTYHHIGMLVITLKGATNTGGSFVIHDEDTSPDWLQVGVGQSAVFGNYVDVYGFSDQRIYDDGGKKPVYNTDEDPEPELEGPVVVVTTGTDTVVNATLHHFMIDDGLGVYGYRAAFYLGAVNSVTTYTVQLSGENVWGGRISSETAQITAYFVTPQYAATLETPDQLARMELPVGSIKAEGVIIASTNSRLPEEFTDNSDDNENQNIYSPVVQIGPEGYKLRQSARLTFHVASVGNLDPDGLAIYARQNGAWVRLGGVFDPETRTISVLTSSLGKFQVRSGAGGLELPTSFALSPAYPNPFNPETHLRFEIPQGSMVQMEVFNIRGQKIADLAHGWYDGGRYEVVWNGLNAAGKRVAGGIYLVRLKAGDFQATRKLVLLK